MRVFSNAETLKTPKVCQNQLLKASNTFIVFWHSIIISSMILQISKFEL